MEVKKLWGSDDYPGMSWHDSAIYYISIPQESQQFVLDIDYLFGWDLINGTDRYQFYVSPCTLTFENTLFLKINIDFKDSVKLFIGEILRSNPRPSPNQKMMIWDYIIETEQGNIEFEATGFSMSVKEQPVLSKSQILGR